MPFTITAKQWKDGTSRWFLSRSDELKAVDAALAEYWDHGQRQADLLTLGRKFEAWVATKPNSALDTARNYQHMVEHLREQLDEALQRSGAHGITAVVVGPEVLRRHRVAPAPTATRKTMTDDDMVTVYTDAVKALWASWDTKTQQQRGQGMIDAASAVHRACGIPPTTPDVKVLPPGYLGFFNFPTWSIQLSETLFNFSKSPANYARLKDLAETVYHEARHCEQWFQMARYFALGRTEDDIRNTLGIGSAHVCREAKRRQITADDKMQPLAEAWFGSVYGGSGRDITLTALALRKPVVVAEGVDVSSFHRAIHAVYSGSLPEEVDAWGIQQLVRAKM